MAATTTTKPATGVWLLGTVLAPLVVMSVGLYATRRLSLDGAGWDYASMAVSILAGLHSLWHLPTRLTFLSRAWVIARCVPAAFGLLLIYSLFFVGIVFGDYL